MRFRCAARALPFARGEAGGDLDLDHQARHEKPLHLDGGGGRERAVAIEALAIGQGRHEGIYVRDIHGLADDMAEAERELRQRLADPPVDVAHLGREVARIERVELGVEAGGAGDIDGVAGAHGLRVAEGLLGRLPGMEQVGPLARPYLPADGKGAQRLGIARQGRLRRLCAIVGIPAPGAQCLWIMRQAYDDEADLRLRAVCACHRNSRNPS